jgi:hypothetical protein
MRTSASAFPLDFGVGSSLEVEGAALLAFPSVGALSFRGVAFDRREVAGAADGVEVSSSAISWPP